MTLALHAPEFAFEKALPNVERAAADLRVSYPVAFDNDYAIWRAFENGSRPAHYFVDAEERIRHHRFGDGDDEGLERVIYALPVEVGHRDLPAGTAAGKATSAEMASAGEVALPETDLGHERAENFVSPGGAVADAACTYSAGTPCLNEWGLLGDSTIGAEQAGLNAGEGGITYRFHARDLHIVLGPGAEGRPVCFRITPDGAPPGDDQGVDVAPDGTGTVTGQRLYQPVRERGPMRERTFEIRFLDTGVQAYAFTLG